LIILTPHYNRPTHAKTEGVPPPFSYVLIFYHWAAERQPRIRICVIADFLQNRLQFSRLSPSYCRISCIFVILSFDCHLTEIFSPKKWTKHLPCLINQCIIYLVKIARDAFPKQRDREGSNALSPANHRKTPDFAASGRVSKTFSMRFLQFLFYNPSIMC